MNGQGTRHRALWIVCIVWILASLTALAFVLAGLEIDRTPTVEAGRSNLSQLPAMWICCASGWAGLTMLWILLRRADEGAAPSNRRGPTIGAILLVAIAARGAVVMTHEPTLSDDVYRYVFDGRNLANGINPYLIRPIDRAQAASPDAPPTFVPLMPPGLADHVTRDEDWPGQRDLASEVNNPELYTIYLPATQYVFATAGWLVPEAHSDVDSSVRIFRGVLVAFDIAAIALLMVVLVRRGRSVWWGALYAWHPLPIIEFAGSGHQDVIGLPLLLLALMAFSAMPRRFWLWSIVLALAALVKPVVAPLAVLLLKRRPWYAWLGSVAIAAAVAAAVSAPLLFDKDGQAIDNVRETSGEFTNKWAHFGSVYEPVLAGLNTIDPINEAPEPWTKRDEHVRTARLICLALVILATIGIFLCRLDAWAACAALLLAMVLLTPAAHPWYLLWALLLLPVTKNGVVWIASLTLPLGYVVLGDVVDWAVSPWVMVAAYAPVYAWLLVSLVRHMRRHEIAPTVLS